MMKTVNYSSLRRFVFSVYIVFAALFCAFLIWLGKNEVAKASSYAENERKYTESLMDCRGRLNHVEQAFSEFHREVSVKNARLLQEQAQKLRLSISLLVRFEKNRDKSLSLSVPHLRKQSLLLHSISIAMEEDINSHPAGRDWLMECDDREFSEALSKLRGIAQALLKAELDNAETWKRQSFYFFNRLQYLLIVFSVLTILFSVSASYLFSRILKSSLTKLSEGAGEISEGNLEYRFKNIQSDEIGSLMCDFNLMALRLQKQSEALHNANRELREKAEQLIEAHHHRDRFLANMSHELRTPLNSVIGFAELIVARHESIDREKVRSYAVRMLGASEHLLDLISDLLEVAKVDAGVLTPVFAKFDLAACVSDICAMLRPIAQKKGLALTNGASENMPVVADRRLIRQVLINLINNALKFTHEGSVKVNVSKTESEYRIDVIDSGIGISKSDLGKIFKDFHRVESGLTSNYEGVGIGLTLSKRLVELHEGRIIVSSEIRKGSSFSVFIPIYNNKYNGGNGYEKND